MKDKIILVTGATSGIGKAAAMCFAKIGATVIIHGRDPVKTGLVRQEIMTATGNQKIDTVVADLFVTGEVRKMAARISEKYERLDVLVNNAGAMMMQQRETNADGLEKTIALNLLAPYLLTWLLLHTLKKSDDARVLVTSSSAHKIARPDFNDMDFTKKYSPVKAYACSKLFQVLMVQRFAAVLLAHGIQHVSINSIHPGGVATNFQQKNFGFFLNVIGKLSRPFFKTADRGADTIVWMAAAAETKNISGSYFVNRQETVLGNKYNTKENETLVWDYCKRLAGN